VIETHRLRPDRYRLYLDESGDHSYQNLDQPSHRYLALLGVWFRQPDDYAVFADDLERFKRGIFGTPDTPVLHRSEVINQRGAFGVLGRPEVRAKFDRGLLGVIERAQFKLICVVIDKFEHLNRYSSPLHPYHYCLAEMLSRYVDWLEYRDAVGDVVAESRGGREDQQLKVAYEQLSGTGRLAFDRRQYRRTLTSKDIKIRPKESNIAGLQLADVLAHPVKQSLLAERGIIHDSGDVFGGRIVEVVRDKLHRNEQTGKIAGYGLIWLPK
jgi:hypothetical protein